MSESSEDLSPPAKDNAQSGSAPHMRSTDKANNSESSDFDEKLDVRLLPGMTLSSSEYQIIEERLLSTLRVENYPQILLALIAMSEYLDEAIKLKSSARDLSDLKQYPPNVSRWLSYDPGFFESKTFGMLWFKNFSWPAMREKHDVQPTSKSEGPTIGPDIVNMAVGSVMSDKLRMPGVDQPVNISKAKKHRVKALTAEMDDFLRQYLHSNISSQTYCGAGSVGLSLISGYNNLGGNLLCGLVYAKAKAMINESDELKIEHLHEGFEFIDQESNFLTNLPKDRTGFFDSGFSSVRLFTKIAAQINRSIAAN